MTPKQEKYLTEKYIRPMVRKMLREDHNGQNDELNGKTIRTMVASPDVRMLRIIFTDGSEVYLESKTPIEFRYGKI